MHPQRSDRTGVLIVRLWLEGDSVEGFRARITQTLDSRTDDQTMSATAAPKDVYAAVQSWVEAFVESGLSASG